MALLKAQKVELAQHYVQELNKAKNTVILKQYGLPVNELTTLRKGVTDAEGKMEVIKKRVFLKGIEGSGSYSGVDLATLDGSIILLHSYNEADEHAPLKVLHKQKKIRTKEKAEFGFDYLGGWYDKMWQTGSYVKELAGLPSKEELIGKFLFLLNHPVSSFARVLQAIADKDGSPVEAPAVEAPAAPAEAKVEEAAPVAEEKAPDTAPSADEVAPEAPEQQAQE